MSSLIVTIIAIVLVAAAALMGAYYGGSSWKESDKSAKAVTLVNQKEQIKTAALLYKSRPENKGKPTPTISDLAADGKYLNSPPKFEDGAWSSAGERVYVSFPENTDKDIADAVCGQAYETETGLDGTGYEAPPCESVGPNDVCCYSD